MAQRFSEIALNFLPTDDKDLKTARTQAESAAVQISALRAAAETKAKAFPWAEWSAAMGSGASPRFMQQLAGATGAAAKVQAEREATAQKIGLADVESQFADVNRQERSVMDRVRVGAELAQASARIQRATNLSTGVGGVGVQTAAVKNTAAQGLTPGTPEFEIEVRRQTGALNMKGDPAYKMALNQLPGVDPNSPEFTAAYAKARSDIVQTKKESVDYKAQVAKEAAAARNVNTRSNIEFKADLTKRAHEATHPLMSQDALDRITDQYLAGDTSVIAGLSRNPQSQNQVLENISKRGKERGLGGADIAAKKSEFSGAMRAQASLGTRLGATAGAVEEANALIPQLKEVHSKVTQLTKYPILNQGILWTLKNTGDANATVLDSRLNTFATVYARAMTGATNPTVDAIRHSRDVIDARMAKEPFDEVLKAMTQEMEIAMAAPGRASRGLSAERKKGGETAAPITWTPADEKRLQELEAKHGPK